MEASSSTPRTTYHVFLSFRGEDTRKNFTDHLYTALVQAGFRTFRDDDEIRRGENIELEIQKAIRESKSSVIVFSKDYGSSRWCLDELVIIMERKKLVDHVVVPVFYDVDPSQVREQTGSFSKAFVRHEERFKEEKERVDGWRAALREVADLGGLVLQDGYESQFIQHIVKEVGNKLSRTLLFVAPHLVGIEYRVKHIDMWLKDGSDDVGIATIYGTGGIGKTTIAKMVYNLNFNNFEGRSFLANVREISEQPNGLARLQRQLLSDILKGKVDKIYNVDEGIMKIKDVIRHKKILLILDDMDELDQFNAIVGMREWFCPGSKIIITTRHERLLRANEVSVMFKVEELDGYESLELLSWHAFGQDYPMHGYETYSARVVYHCSGLPLALQVLGSSLSGKTPYVWESTLKKLESIADNKVQKILRISYDSLEDDHDKSLFLDIACFLTGLDIDYVVKILDGCNFFTTIGIQNLKDKCLITISEKNRLAMHHLVRDMGREVVRQESPYDPGKRSRLWNNKDTFIVLRENTGTESIRGLNLNLPMLMEGEHEVSSSSYARHDDDSSENAMKTHLGNCLKRQRLSFFSWQPVNDAWLNSFPTMAFTKMQELKLLHLSYVNLSGGYEDIPRTLAWLRWRGFPLNSLPIEFCLEKLVVLDMRNSNLKHVWKGIRFLGKLKILNLSHSLGLVRTPNFKGLPNLERLVLKDCISLVEVDESIGDLKRLILLNLKDCRTLKKLPVRIHMLKSLEELIVSGCLNLVMLAEELGKLDSLRVLQADGTAINQKNNSTKGSTELGFSRWYSLFWSWLLPRRYPQSRNFSLASLPSSLVSLSLGDCQLSDNVVPKDLSCLPSLKNLNLSGNLIYSLPESINSLTLLESLVLDRCTSLHTLPELPTSLGLLKAENCTSLERIRNLPTEKMESSSTPLDLVTYGCDKLVEVQGFFRLDPISNINIHMLNTLGLFNLESLESTEVDLFNALSCTEKKTTVQVLHECGICSIFLPGSEVPDWFNHQNEGSSISFELPPAAGGPTKTLCFSLCILYMCCDLTDGSTDENCVTINNKTKGLGWNYIPTFYGVPRPSMAMLWLSHWNFGDQFESGDQVHISVDVTNGLQVKECGICLIDEQEERGVQSYNKELVQSTSPWYLIQLRDPRRWRNGPSTSYSTTNDEENEWDDIIDDEDFSEQNSDSEDSDK